MKTTHGKIPRRTRDLNLLGGAVWILPGVAKILATLLSTGAFATDERGMARVLTLSCILQRARWRQARTSCVFCPTTPPEPPADRPATRKLRHPTVAAHIMTATQPTGRNSRKHVDKLIFLIKNDGNHINTGFSYKHDGFHYIQMNYAVLVLDSTGI